MSKDQKSRQSAINQVIHDCLRRRAAGEIVSDEQLIREHPSLIPELAEALAKISGESASSGHIDAAADTVTHLGGSSQDQTETYHPPVQAEPLPESIGRYRIKRVIASGGMGVVYEAIQEHPRRTVAVKTMRHAIRSRSAQRRFEYEAQLLARLRHPNIAQIYEAGTYQRDGEELPFFAMEYIPNAKPITAYAQGRRLSTHDRLKLFDQVCHGVHHGHQKGIIHRDIKPSNLLVDSQGQCKIIDFGVARSTDSDMALTTLQTDVGQLVGTLQYMSPEQVEADPHDIDVRSDIYALGVVFYELLTDQLPYDLTRAAMVEAARMIKEQAPVRLSSLNRSLRGDIETIVEKALAKERDRRYQSADELRLDIGRYLSNEPVSARPPSVVYQVRKLVARHKVSFGFMIVLMAVIVGFGVWMTVLYARADRARIEAETARADATKRAEELKVVTDFQASMLSDIDAEQMGRNILEDQRKSIADQLKQQELPECEIETKLDTFDDLAASMNFTDLARRIVDVNVLSRAAAAIVRDFVDQPSVRAALQQTIASTYREIGLYDSAMPLQVAAFETRRRVLGDTHPDTLHSINSMGFLLRLQGKLNEAEPYYREALETRRHVLGDEHPNTLDSINNMGVLLRSQGKPAEAETYSREAMEVRRRVLGDEHPDTLDSINNMGALLWSQGKLAEAEPYYREALEGFRSVLGDDHPNTLALISNMGALLRSQGKLNDAEPYFREALEARRRVLGDDHPSTLASTYNMGLLLWSQGKLAEAEPYYLRALEGYRRVLGNDHPDTLRTTSSVGHLLKSQGKLAEAETYLYEALEGRRRTLGDEHPDTLRSMNNMGLLLEAQGKLTEAEQYYLKTLETRRRLLGDENPNTVDTINNLGILYWSQGRLTEAESLYREALETRRRTLGDNHPDTLASISNMGALLRSQDKLSEAESYSREAVEGFRRVLGDEHPHTLDSINNLGTLLLTQGKLDEAEPYYREAMETRRRVLGEDHPDTLTSIGNLGALLNALGRHKEALESLQTAESAARSAWTGSNVWRLGNLLVELGRAQGGLHEFVEGEATLLEAHKLLAEGLSDADDRTINGMNQLIALYEAWNLAEPDEGYDAKANAWRAKLEAAKQQSDSD